MARKTNTFRILLIAAAMRCGIAAPAFAPFRSFGNFSLRTDFCGEAQRVARGELSMRNVLSGKNLVVALPDPRISPWGSKPDYLKVDLYGDLNGGVLMNVLNALSQRAGFSYTSSYVFLPGLPEYPRKTWDEYLQWAVGAHDLVAEHFLLTADRQALGVSFIRGWYDSSLLLIVPESPADNSVGGIFDTLMAFAEPFEWKLWAVTGGVLLVSNFVFLLVNTDGDQGLIKTPNEIVLMRPRSLAVSLFVWAYTIMIILVSFAYLANMTSFILMREERAVYGKLTTLDVVMESKLSICVSTASEYNQGPIEARLKARYPIANVVELDTPSDVIRELLAGKQCASAAMPRAEWQELTVQKRFNPGCELDSTERRLAVSELVLEGESGFASMADCGGSGSKCSSIISQACISMFALLRGLAEGLGVGV
jgi:hypothetical protein